MELWFTEKQTESVNFSIKISRQLFSKKSDFQQIDIFESPEFGRFLALWLFTSKSSQRSFLVSPERMPFPFRIQ